MAALRELERFDKDFMDYSLIKNMCAKALSGPYLYTFLQSYSELSSRHDGQSGPDECIESTRLETEKLVERVLSKGMLFAFVCLCRLHSAFL